MQNSGKKVGFIGGKRQEYRVQNVVEMKIMVQHNIQEMYCCTLNCLFCWENYIWNCIFLLKAMGKYENKTER
jgi:hypothetical protein